MTYRCSLDADSGVVEALIVVAVQVAVAMADETRRQLKSLRLLELVVSHDARR